MITVIPAEFKILVVDDEAEVARGTAHALTSAGYVTALAFDGEEALRNAESFLPHLILSDRDMPGIDGLELCRRIKASGHTADCLVVIISGTHTATGDRVTGLGAGADCYVLRPITNRELLAWVEAFARIVCLTRELRARNAELVVALAKVKSLHGLLPICAGCKKIRDDQGYWSQVEVYVEQHSSATFTHGVCPHCVKKYFPDLGEDTLAGPT